MRTHQWILDLAHGLEPDPPAVRTRRDGASVRREVEGLLDTLPERFPARQVPSEPQEKVASVGTVLRRLRAGLYSCYDVAGLPHTDTELEHFSRQRKAGGRRATGHRRSDAVVVRVGGFAAYAAAARCLSEPALCTQLAAVPAEHGQAARAILRATQQRQIQMHRFHLRPDRYLHDLEARWSQLADAP